MPRRAVAFQPLPLQRLLIEPPEYVSKVGDRSCRRAAHTVELLASLAPVVGRLLVTLELPGCCELNDEALAEAALSFPALEHVSIERCSLVGTVGVCALARECEFLASLNANDVNPDTFDDHAIVALADCRSLTELSVARACQITDCAIEALAGAASGRLRAIDVSYCERLTDASVGALVAAGGALERLGAASLPKLSGVACIAGLSSLVALNLSGILPSQMSAHDFALLSPSLPHLTSLELEQWYGARDTALEAMHALKLERLSVCYAVVTYPYLTDGAFSDLFAIAGRSLVDLDLSWCEHVGDSSLRALAKAARGLKRLRVNTCMAITDAGVIALVLDEEQAEVVGACSLTELDIGGCSAITDSAVLSVARNACRMSRLTLSGLPLLTQVSPRAVMKWLPSIELVDFSGCTGIPLFVLKAMQMDLQMEEVGA